jgi:pilus assembly protein CpaB
LASRNRSILIVIAGILLLAVGVGAAILLIQRMNAQAQAQQQPQAQVVKSTVVVLNRDMLLGDRITAADVTTSEVPVEVVPRDALTATDAAVGKILKADVVQGEMLLAHNLADPTNNNHDLSYILADDHVLLAFPASDLMSTDNIIQRGDIIDIFATFQEEVKNVGNTTTAVTTTTGNEQPVMRTFTVNTFQKVSVTALVLDVVQSDQNNTAATATPDQNAQTAVSRTNTKIRSYLLALPPQDALVLKHLKDTNATFDFVIRAPTSTTQFDLTPVTSDYIVELYGLEILP